MENILDFTKEELKEKLKFLKEKPFRATQILEFIYDKKENQFDNMTNISKDTREKLKENFYIGTPEIIKIQSSRESGTKKFLLKFLDGEVSECVLMKYKFGYSLCISTQIGCRMGCEFCASTLNGLVRNISPGEMIGQILRVESEIKDRISHVVLMGMGEPFDNFDNTMKFLDLAIDELKLGSRKITISTCGIIPKIIEMAEKHPQVNLAISLHATKDEDRNKIMPINKKYALEELMFACRKYVNETSRRITFEYALINGVNDGEEKAIELSNLLKKMICHVNIIPLNEISEKNYKKPNQKKIFEFVEILEKNGITATIRKELGADIDAACGQLRNKS